MTNSQKKTTGYAKISLGINPLEKVITAIVAVDTTNMVFLGDIKKAAEKKLREKYGVTTEETVSFTDWRYLGTSLEFLLE